MKIPPKIFHQIFSYGLPLLFIFLNFFRFEPSWEYFLFSSFSSVFPVFFTSKVNLLISIFLIYLNFFFFNSFLYFFSLGFIYSFSFNTKILITVNIKKIFFLIKIVALFLGCCFTNLLIFNVFILFFSLFSIYSEECCTETKYIFYKMKKLIKDNVLICREYKEYLINDCNNVFVYDFNLFLLLFILSKNKILFLFFNLLNSILNINIKHIEFLLITFLIIDIDFTILMLFYKSCDPKNITLNLIIISFIYFIKN